MLQANVSVVSYPPPPCLADLISSARVAIIGMFVGFAIVAMLLRTLIAIGSGAVKSASVLDPSEVPKMILLDGIKAYVIFEIIALDHYGTNFFRQRLQYNTLVMMSGFLAFSMEFSKRDSFDWPGSAAYLARRLARLVPGYYAIMMLSLAANGLAEPYIQYPLDSLLAQSFFTGSTCNGFWLPFGSDLGHLWFVSMIMWQAVCVPMLFNTIPKLCKNASYTACAYVTIVGIIYLRESRGLGEWPLGAIYPLHENSPLFQLLNTSVGCLTAQMYLILPQHVREKPIWLFIMPASLILLVMGWDGARWGITMQALLFPIILLSSRCAAEVPKLHETSRFSGLGWLISSIGYYSYGAYLYQWLALDVTSRLALPYVRELAILLSWIMAILSDYILETPFCQHVNQKLKQGQ